MATKPSDYLSVKTALYDEESQPIGKRREAVIQACKSYLAVNKPPLFTTHIEKTLTPEKE